MKISCTTAEKNWLVHLMEQSDRCPMRQKCDTTCAECCEKSVEWTIDDSAAPSMELKPTCGECAHFLGAGDWDMCCELPHPEYPYGHLCYEWTPSCERFKKKGEEGGK